MEVVDNSSEDNSDLLKVSFWDLQGRDSLELKGLLDYLSSENEIERFWFTRVAGAIPILIGGIVIFLSSRIELRDSLNIFDSMELLFVLSVAAFSWLSICLSYSLIYLTSSMSLPKKINSRMRWSSHELVAIKHTEAQWIKVLNEALLYKAYWMNRCQRAVRIGIWGAFVLIMAGLAGVVGSSTV